MTTRMKTLTGLALACVLGSATATLAQKGDADRPTAASREIGPFVRVGNYFINVSRVDYLEIRKAEGSEKWVSIYLSGRPNAMPTVRAAEATELLRMLGQPPIEQAVARP